MNKLATTLLALAALVATGCHKSSSSHTVALFANADYVDYAVDDTHSEAWDMEQALAAMDRVSTTTFTGLTAADLTAAVKGKDVLIMPEEGSGRISIDDAGLAVIKDFVDAGGTLIMASPWDDDGMMALVNDAFGFSVTEGDEAGDTISKTSAAANTDFEGGPEALDVNDSTATYAVSSLPEDARVIYAVDVTGDAVVAVIPSGAGRIVLLGYDWYDGKPAGTQDGGWLAVLDTAVRL